MFELISRRNELEENEKKVLTEIGLFSLNRNFGGLETSNSFITNIFKNLYGYKYDESAENNKKFSVIDAIEKNLLNCNTRYLMLISEGNDGNDIVKYIIKSLNKNYIELIGSKYKKDRNSGSYIEEVLNKVKYIMGTDNILILKDLKMIYPSLYDLFNQNFSTFGDKNFARIAFEYAKISSEVNKDFHVIVIVNKNEIQNLKLDPPFLNRFEKHIINFSLLLEERDIEIAKNIVDYIDIVSSFNKSEELKIYLEKLLVNCQLHHIEGLIFKTKKDAQNGKMKNYEWLLKKGDAYKEMMTKEIFKKIVPLFCQDIIAAIANLDLNQNPYNRIVFEIYKETNFNNFILFFESIQKRKNIIYTLSKATGDFLDEKFCIKNKFGTFTYNSIELLMVESIKSENELIFLLKGFANSQDKNLIIFKFTEEDLKKMNYLGYVISLYEKENKKLLNKVIIFLAHKRRLSKIIREEKPYKSIETITFLNDEYEQVFIDNLQGKENIDILDLIQKKDSELIDEYIYNYHFIDNKIFNVLNYFNCQILYETDDLNSRNYITQLSEKIKNNKIIKEYLIINLKEHGKSIMNIIKDVFIEDIIEINDIDFFEIINTKLNSFFCQCLSNIILYSFEEEVLNQILIDKTFKLIRENSFIDNLVNQHFKNTKFNKKAKMKVNSNKVMIYNCLEIPKSKLNIENLMNYMKNGLISMYKQNEESLRKNIKKEEIQKKIDNYYNNYEIIKQNIITIINNKCELIKEIYDHDQIKIELRKMLLDDYLKYLIIKYTYKNKIHNQMNGKLLNLLYMMIKVKLCENINTFEFKNSIDEFISIILFTQGYFEDIQNIFDIFIEISKFNHNFDKIIAQILSENKMVYEISYRNEEYTKIVNIYLFKIIESIIRGMLIYSIDLLKRDKAKFFEYFSSFSAIEAIIQKINKKYYLFSKEIYNLRIIIKIDETNKFFDKDYEKIVENLLKQSILSYNKDYHNLYMAIINLIKIIDEIVKEKNEKYENLLFFILYHQYKNIINEEIRLKILETFFSNKLLLKKSKLFLYLVLKDLKPEIPKNKSQLIPNFLNISKMKNFKNIINIINNIHSNEFNELLLFFLEERCQSYFSDIIKKNNNELNSNCCTDLLLNFSFEYLKEAVEYLCKHNENNDNIILKLLSIAFIKSYFYHYVDINFHHHDKINSEEINNIFYNKNENNEKVMKMINIYILRLYCRKFENFEQFMSYNQNICLIKSLSDKLLEIKGNKIENNYIFEHSFIPVKNFDNYKDLIMNMEKKDIDIKEINNYFDNYYCYLVNKIISFVYGKDKNETIQKMNLLYQKTFEKINLEEEGKILYKYLLDYNLLTNEIKNKITDNLSQNDFEILLYSLRFILNNQTNNLNNFYNTILKSNSYNFIQSNYMPGSFPVMDEYMKSYYTLEQNLKLKYKVGYYICSECGYLYEVGNCTFPTTINKCPNGHDIGGEDHICKKKDIRIFSNKEDLELLKSIWFGMEEWFNSFTSLTIKEFKENYIDKKSAEPKKGINSKDYNVNHFESSFNIRNLNIITFRILNFILYSFLLGSYLLNNLSKEESNYFLIENLFPHTLFGIIKKNWELIDKSLREFGIENIQIFMNMIFDKVLEIINNLKSLSSVEELNLFETRMDEYIVEILNKEENIKKLNDEYKKMNTELISFDPYSLKEIIQSNVDPAIYDQFQYPNIQYFCFSKLQNFEIFVNKFNSSRENETRYPLINLLIQKDKDITKDAINLKILEPINNLSNILLKIYSYKISREDAKKITLKEKINEIIDNLYGIYQDNSLDKKKFEQKYINPFINSWNIIKKKAIQYKCKELKNVLEISEDRELCYFLVDDGETGFGMFLASAYEQMISWQNKFIDYIIDNNIEKGILNSYIPLLQQETNIQDATQNEILKLDDKLYKEMYSLINQSSMRNIYTTEGKINYKNYNDILYEYDFIENELGKKILPGIKKFKEGKIKFMTYLFEGFLGDKTSILSEVNEKYPQKELSLEEKNRIKGLLKVNNTKQFYSEIFSSLQMIINYIIKDYYDPNTLISQIVNSLPNLIIPNQSLKDFFKEKFAVNSILSIYEYFELLCWDQIKISISEIYNLEIDEITKNNIIEYFEKNDKNKLINKKDFINALRKLMSRYLIGNRQDADFNESNSLNLYINKYEFWKKEIKDNDNFELEINEVCPEKIKLSNCRKLYDILEGDKYVKEENKNQIGVNKENQNVEDFDGDIFGGEIKNDEGQKEERDWAID